MRQQNTQDHAKSLDAEVSLIRGIILNGFAMKQNIVETDEERATVTQPR